mmetsp:Transcript_35614/g.33772  ORF Transcript_35614/g.33772 Transcript_35614/m.33772 type:complete len:383 (-) Transcript_35614:124-1272(-)
MRNIYWSLTICIILKAFIQGGYLKGRVALVTGASRGIGRGIALGLAEQGCTVYITGRSVGGSSTDTKVGGTLEEVVSTISTYGGKGIAVACDHAIDTDVQKVYAQIEEDHGRLDILVNNAFQVPVPPNGIEDKDLLFKNFWEQPGWFWDSLMKVGLRSTYISTVYAMPLLKKTVENKNSSYVSNELPGSNRSVFILENKTPLIVHISSFGGVSYSFNVAYGVGKAGIDKMAKDMHTELKALGIACLSLYPGIVSTERMKDMLSETGDWQEKTGLAPSETCIETPVFQGRVIAALYKDADKKLLSERSGEINVSAEVAKKLKITDITGKSPLSIRSVKYLIPAVVLGKYKSNVDIPKGLSDKLNKYSPDILLPFSFFSKGPPQ